MSLTRPVIWPYRLAMAVIWLGLVTLMTIVGYILWPTQTIYIAEPIPVENTDRSVKSGGILFLVMSYNKPYDTETLIGVMIVHEGTVWILPVGLGAIPPSTTREGNRIRIPVHVPHEIPPGEYIAVLTFLHPVKIPLPTVFHSAIRANSEPFRITGN